MRSPDVNVLVSAFREDAVHHERCRSWLFEALSSRDRVAVIGAYAAAWPRRSS